MEILHVKSTNTIVFFSKYAIVTLTPVREHWYADERSTLNCVYIKGVFQILEPLSDIASDWRFDALRKMTFYTMYHRPLRGVEAEDARNRNDKIVF